MIQDLGDLRADLCDGRSSPFFGGIGPAERLLDVLPCCFGFLSLQEYRSGLDLKERRTVPDHDRIGGAPALGDRDTGPDFLVCVARGSDTDHLVSTFSSQIFMVRWNQRGDKMPFSV